MPSKKLEIFSANTISKVRSSSIIALIIVVLAIFFVNTDAFFSGDMVNKGNKITTGSQSLRLFATDIPITVISEDGSPTVAPKFPEYVSDLYRDGNSIISLDTYDNNYKRKFLEFGGVSGIQGVGANFRQQRALIVSNESDEKLTYSLAFKTQKLGENDLSSAFYFNYTRVGENIENVDFHNKSGVKLSPAKTIDNLGVSIKTIGEQKPVQILPRCTHVYIVDMGVLYSAGNSYLNAGLQLDIVLTMSQGSVGTYAINDMNSFIAAIGENEGSATFVLEKDVIISKPLKSTEVFNLNLNGFTLDFVEKGALEVKFPNRQAAMDFGSMDGGQIHGAEAVSFVGVNGKSVLNWYPDITGLEKPSKFENVIVSNIVIPNYAPPSSKPPDNSNTNSSSNGNSSSTSSSKPVDGSSDMESSSNNSSDESSDNSSDESSDTSSDNSSDTSSLPGVAGYTDFNNIDVSNSYADGDGSREAPFVISTLEEFKKFIFEPPTEERIFFHLAFTVSHLKNLPEDVLEKEAALQVDFGCKLEYLDFDAPIPRSEPSNPFKGFVFFQSGFQSDYFNHVSNITYRDSEVF